VGVAGRRGRAHCPGQLSHPGKQSGALCSGRRRPTNGHDRCKTPVGSRTSVGAQVEVSYLLAGSVVQGDAALADETIAPTFASRE